MNRFDAYIHIELPRNSVFTLEQAIELPSNKFTVNNDCFQHDGVIDTLCISRRLYDPQDWQETFQNCLDDLLHSALIPLAKRTQLGHIVVELYFFGLNTKTSLHLSSNLLLQLAAFDLEIMFDCYNNLEHLFSTKLAIQYNLKRIFSSIEAHGYQHGEKITSALFEVESHTVDVDLIDDKIQLRQCLLESIEKDNCIRRTYFCPYLSGEVQFLSRLFELYDSTKSFTLIATTTQCSLKILYQTHNNGISCELHASHIATMSRLFSGGCTIEVSYVTFGR